MSILNKASSGAITRPQVITIYGPNGVGKTTLAAKFPLPYMLDLEDGSGAVADANFKRASRADIPDLETLTAELNALLSDCQDRKTLIIDSVEALESLIHRSLTKTHKVESIEDIAYGKGMVMAREKMEEIMRLLQTLRDKKGLTVILVGHSIQKAFNDPAKNLSYDRHIMRANDKFASVIKDLSDAIYFVNHAVLTEVSKMNPTKAKAFSTGERTIFTTWSHSHDAKSRFQLPSEINFSLVDVEKTVQELMPSAKNDSIDDLIHIIKQQRSQIADKSLGEKIDKTISDAGHDVAKLRSIKTRLTEILQQTV